jgi:tetratricopeptide (TPR) repeat protein
MLSLSANLATLGNVLLQRGQLAEAQEQFAAAEKTYRDVYPNHPYLARLPGYNYCDLLLTLGRLDEVEPRAAFIEEEATGRRPYGVALARLAMARRRTALVERGGAAEQSNALAIMADACAKLRQTGHTEMILRGLLASAELHRRTGFVDLAQTELDEVLESAARVQMKLLEADAHLQMAYTEAAVGNTSRKQVHVDLCRGMVQAFGYNRLEAELRALEGQQAETRPAALARANTAAGVSVLMSRMPPNDHGFARIQQEFTDLYLRAHPVDGTQLGMRENDNSLLPPMDPRERADLFASLTASAHALRAASEASGISDDIVDGELAVAGIRGMRIVEDALRPYARNPGVYLDAVVRGIYALLARGDLTVEEKLPALAQRMMAVPAYLARGQRQISRSPRVIVDNAVGDAEGGVQFLNNELRDFLQALPDDPRARDLEKKRVEAAEAVEVFRQFVIGLAATATDEFALGRAAFDALLRDVHQVRFDADELGDLGRSVVADLEADLGRAALKAAGHNRWWEAATSVEARYPTRESLLDDYRAVLERARHFVRDRDLVGLTAVGPLVVQATPPFARANLPFAAYVPAPPFASSGRGEFWVTPPSEGLSHAAELATLQRHHTGRLLVACVHEGYPGHHTQFDHAAHVNRPLRHFFASTVFSEGWGLYCEDLMRREGFMLDGPDGPGLEISMLRDQLWRALRIVIDVGLHCKEMTREQAVSLLVDKHVLDQDSAASEVMYYCSAPTQPMSYMVGRILMDSSIKKCAAARGHEVPLGRIRDEVLSHGSLPFPLLERSLGLHGKQP